MLTTYTLNPFQRLALENGPNAAALLQYCRKSFNMDLMFRVPQMALLFVFLASIFSAQQISEHVAVLIVGSLACSLLLYVIQRSRLNKHLNQIFNNSHHDKPIPRPSMTGVSQQIIIHGGFNPFVGAGIQVGQWSIALWLRKSTNTETGNASTQQQHRGTAGNVDTNELSEHIQHAIQKLQIAGSRVGKAHLIDGRLLGANKELFDSYKTATLEWPTRAHHLLETAKYHNQVRSYTFIQSAEYNGELIVTYYNRVTTASDKLVVESQQFVLTPLHERYRLAASAFVGVPQLGLGTWIAVHAARWILHFAISPFLVVGMLASVHSRNKNSRREMQFAFHKANKFNFGWTDTVREVSASGEYTSLLQRVSVNEQRTLIDKTVLDTIVEHLEAKQYDTSELRSQQSNILNYGLIVSGGQLSASNIAVGPRSNIQATPGKH